MGATLRFWSILSRLFMGAKESRAQLIHRFGQGPSGGTKVLGGSKIQSKERMPGGSGRPWGPATCTLRGASPCKAGRSVPWRGSAYVHQRRIDVVAGFSVHRDEEGQAAVQRQDIHAPVLIVVPRQEPDAAVLGPDVGRHNVEGLWAQRWTDRHSSDACPEQKGRE